MTILKGLLISCNNSAWLLPRCASCERWFLCSRKWIEQITFIVSCHVELEHLLAFGSDGLINADGIER